MNQHIFIKSNTGYSQELEYTCDVIFKSFWGIHYVLDNNEIYNKNIIQLQIDDKTISITSNLFNTHRSHWFTKQSHPTLPLRIRRLDDFKGIGFMHSSVPVVYGMPYATHIQDTSEPFDIDIFGTIFFILTRYEEIGYHTTDLDAVGRYKEELNLAFRANFYNRAIVNEYLEILWFLIQQKTCGRLNKAKRQYRIMVSHDIDFPLSIANRDVFKLVKNMIGDLYIRRSVSVLLNRVIAKIQSSFSAPFIDPYSTFDYLMQCAEKYNYHCTFNFIPCNDPKSLDGTRAVDYKLDTLYFNQVFRTIHQRGHQIGFHPSYISFCNLQQTAIEYNHLLYVMDRSEIKQNSIGGRQHFLRWHNPQTWQIWNELGLHYDSTIGYHGMAGFKAGICYEYPVFDLINRKKLNLIEIPLLVMDAAALNLSSSKFTEHNVLNISSICKHYGGIFTLLYHNNHVVSGIQKEKYEQILQAIQLV